MKYKAKLLTLSVYAVAAAFFLMVHVSQPASAVMLRPAFMDRYANDPYSKEELRGKCTICHIGRGGGERNDFGEAFEDAGFRITPKLRARYPELFENESR